jgi:hypothetical protein
MPVPHTAAAGVHHMHAPTELACAMHTTGATGTTGTYSPWTHVKAWDHRLSTTSQSWNTSSDDMAEVICRAGAKPLE